MIDYVDPIPPVIRLLKSVIDAPVYGNTMPNNPKLPCVLIRNAGGLDYTRLQLLTRGNSDIESMNLLVRAMNELIRHSSNIGLRGVWIERESNPISIMDEDTGKPESWCYMRMEHIEV